MNVFRYTVLWGLTFLVIIPYTTIASAALSLREEAVTHRVQGYEAQQRGDLVEARSSYSQSGEDQDSVVTLFEPLGDDEIAMGAAYGVISQNLRGPVEEVEPFFTPGYPVALSAGTRILIQP